MATRDGRRVRDPELTRASILDAALALFAEGRYHPTALEIAARAAVAPRTVFVHFADLDAVAVATARRQAGRWLAHAVPIPTEWPLERRVDALLGQRSKMYEQMTPVRRGGLVREGGSAGLHAVLQEGDAWFRANTAAAFAPELVVAELERGHDVDAPGEFLDALDAAVSWAAWDHLRSRRGLTRPAATRAIRQTLLALLAPVTPGP